MGAVVQLQAATKQCPFCAESILVAAAKCKHCGSDQPTEPPCRQCGGVIIKDSYKVTPGGIIALGVILILCGTVGVPFFGLGFIGIIVVIVLMTTIKTGVPYLRCKDCKAVRASKTGTNK